MVVVRLSGESGQGGKRTKQRTQKSLMIPGQVEEGQSSRKAGLQEAEKDAVRSAGRHRDRHGKDERDPFVQQLGGDLCQAQERGEGTAGW